MRDELLEILEGEPPEVRRAVEAALRIVEDESVMAPEQAAKQLAKIGLKLAKNAEPSPAMLIHGIEALVSLIKWGVGRRRRRIARSRRIGTGQGLIAWQASRRAGR
jgi:hypothetical protein